MSSKLSLRLKKVLTILTMTILTASLALVLTDKPAVVRAAEVTAKCNNNTSDATTINNAISGSAVGDEIVIQGTCSINATIKLLGDRSYRGESRSGTVLKQANGANLTALLASDSWVNNSTTTGNPTSVRQLTLDGNKANNPTTATDGLVIRSWLTAVEDTYIRNCKGSGIRLTNKSANNTNLTNTQVNGRIAGNFIDASDSHGIYIQDSQNNVTDWQLLDNWVGGSGLSGIRIENAAGWMVERNHIYGVQTDAIYADRLYGSTIADNYIESFGQSATVGTYYGVNTKVQGNLASTISNNRVFSSESNGSSTYRYIGARGNYGIGVIAVTGNVIRGISSSLSTGLYYDQMNGTGLTVSSTGNTVTNVNTPLTTVGAVTVGAGI